MDDKKKTITIRLPNDLYKAVKKTVVDDEKTIGQYFIDLAIEDLKRKELTNGDKNKGQ